MNTPHLEEIKVNYNTEEWISAFPGGITSIEVDGDKLISLRKVNKTLERLKILSVLLAGVLIGVLVTHLSEEPEKEKTSQIIDRTLRLNVLYSKKLKSLGYTYQGGGKWDEGSGNKLATPGQSKHLKRD